MRITLFGDSVFAGLGLEPVQRPDARLQALLGSGFTVTNVGIPDQTTADALARAATIEGDLVLIGFGLNDAIEGVERSVTIANLQGLRRIFGHRGCLVEMLVPDGARWPAHTKLRGAVAEASGDGAFVPDILRGLCEADGLQADGLHPNAIGAAIVAKRPQRTCLERTAASRVGR